MRTILEAVGEIKRISNNASRAGEYDEDTLVEINELVDEILTISTYKEKGKKPKTNFDMCCESMEAMAQIIDIAKIGWTKKQIMEWLQSESGGIAWQK